MKHLLTVAVLAIPFALSAQTGSKPVPPKWLRDGRLAVPEFNFSIKSPSPDSKWSYQDLPKSGSTAFITEAGDGKYAVVIYENSKKMDSTSREQFIAGMRDTIPKDWQLRDTRLEASDVPLKDSSRFKITIGLPDGTPYYSYGYIVSGNRTYQTITFSTSSNEPVPFTQFARSFALLQANAKR